ncbi:uncharacterized protein PRCAT00002203001, partial [Priceomyces carsonii]|uniref:uncharacterized protein n=1 Tax=Priceomyces carsonii TaxID=28549 RepID=UPI002EDBAAB1
SGIKKSLKAAKKSIEENDPQSALEFVEEALEEDNSNYFAIIFQGKAYQLLNEPAKASKSFIKATSLEPDNLLGWKGYFQVLRSQSDYNEFFKVATELIRKQIDQGIGIADTIKDIRNYLSQNNFKSNKDLNEAFLRSVLPGSDLGNLVGSDLGRPEDNLKALIELVKRDEAEKVSKALSSEKMKLPRVLTPEQKLHLSNITWAFYKESDLSQLYEEFLNISNDDSLREQFKEDLLKYKYEVVKVCPEKEQLFQEIKEMVEGMILLKTKSLFCWTLYFDWSDVTDLARIDFENIIFFLKNFENEGLGMVLYSFLMSDISPFDKARILRGIGSEKNQNEYENPLQTEDAVSFKEDSELIEPEEQTPSDQPLPPAQVLSLMLKGFSKCEQSIMANRIICGYYVHLHEYTEALERCRGAIKLLADVQRTCGIDLVNTREDILCSLAITYTFYEAPKNFARALQLYERVLTRNEKNIKARIGKALILVEKNDLHGAMGLLSTVVEENPDDPQALTDYCWCQVKLGDYSPGRLGLIKALTLVQGTDLYSRELRAVIQWRIAKSFLLPDNDKDKGIEIINKAYHYLIRSLKDANNYAPSYTLLGVLYHDYYGDKQRAHKCFYKAFELDESELLAAKYLVDDFTSRNEWNIAEILCKRIANSERSRRVMYNKQHEYSDSCWPYRVLGCSSLNIQDDGKAIEWFQAALRISPADVDCWSGLGEAYFNCGRFDAAAKVFRHTLTIDGDSWTTNYFFGHVLCEMEEFEEGFKHLNRALKIQKNEAT